MPQIFPFPNQSQSESLLGYTSYANSVSDGIFIPLFIWAVFIITFIASKNFETPKALAVASFISMMISIMFAVLGLSTPRFMYLFIILLGGALVWLKLQTGRIG